MSLGYAFRVRFTGRIVSERAAADKVSWPSARSGDGSAGGRQKAMYRIGGGLNVVPVDRFFQDFYRPGLLAEVHGTAMQREMLPFVQYILLY